MLEESLKAMLTSLPLVQELHHPAMRERHWQQLMSVSAPSGAVLSCCVRSCCMMWVFCNIETSVCSHAAWRFCIECPSQNCSSTA